MKIKLAAAKGEKNLLMSKFNVNIYIFLAYFVPIINSFCNDVTDGSNRGSDDRFTTIADLSSLSHAIVMLKCD